MLQFGTGGFRGVIGEDFTKQNVQLIAEALARIAEREGKTDLPVAVGYDNRFTSDRAAMWLAEVFAAHGIRVWLIPYAAPTPSVMFTVKSERLHYGAMVTASHNPYIFNGVKLFTEGGMDADAAFTGRMEREIANVTSVRSLPAEKIPQGGLVRFDVREKYLDFIQSFLSPAAKGSGIRILYDNLNGVGAGMIAPLADRMGWCVDVLNAEHDAFFSFKNPNPTESAIAPLAERLRAGGYAFAMATDSDADRLGILDERGQYVGSNDILAALYYYLVRCRGMRGDVVKNCATSLLLDKLAQKLGFVCHEVDVGFKNVSQKMDETDALIGGESSGGLTVRGYVKGKDSVFSSALFTEMAVCMRKPVSEIVREVRDFAGYDLYSVEREIKLPSLEEARACLDSCTPPAGEKLLRTLRFGRNVKFLLEDGWALLRLSGTEPAVRIFAELPTKVRAERAAEALKSCLAAAGRGCAV